MEDIIVVVVVACASAVAYFAGSMTSPMAKVYRHSATQWQGMYGKLQKEMNAITEEIKATQDANDPIAGLLKQFGLSPDLAKLIRPALESPQVQKWIQSQIANIAKQGGREVGGAITRWQ